MPCQQESRKLDSEASDGIFWIWGFPKIGGTLWGVNNEEQGVLGFILGSPYLGRLTTSMALRTPGQIARDLQLRGHGPEAAGSTSFCVKVQMSPAQIPSGSLRGISVQKQGVEHGRIAY